MARTPLPGSLKYPSGPLPRKLFLDPRMGFFFGGGGRGDGGGEIKKFFDIPFIATRPYGIRCMFRINPSFVST